MAARARSVGFFSSPKGGASVVGDDNALLRFDSGEALSFAEGQRNILVLGQNGSGKTASAVLPMLDACVRAGYGGVVLDVKGNLTGQLRKIARRHGRVSDVIEIGDKPSARKINLLARMSVTEIYGILKLLSIKKGMHNSHNYSWYLRGINDIRNFAALMRFIARTEKLSWLEPSFRLLKHFATDWRLATGLRVTAEKLLKGPLGKRKDAWALDARECLDNVLSGMFCFMNMSGKNGGNQTWHEQVSWRLEAVMDGLSCLAQSPGCMDNFSACESEDGWLDFDLRKLVYGQKKIIAVHFTPSAGAAAEKLALVVKNAWYQAVIENGLFLPEGERTFTFADEFQATASFCDDDGMSDQRFFSMSREFRNINVIATQNVDNLMSDECARHGAEALLSNCATHVYLQTSARRTAGWIAESCGGEADVRSLGRGECIVNHVGQDGHADVFKDSLNDAYKKTAMLGPSKMKPFRRPEAKRVVFDEYLKKFWQTLGGMEATLQELGAMEVEIGLLPSIRVPRKERNPEAFVSELHDAVWPLLAAELRRDPSSSPDAVMHAVTRRRCAAAVLKGKAGSLFDNFQKAKCLTNEDLAFLSCLAHRLRGRPSGETDAPGEPPFFDVLPERFRNDEDAFRAYAKHGKTKAFGKSEGIGKDLWLWAVSENPANVLHMPAACAPLVDANAFLKRLEGLADAEPIAFALYAKFAEFMKTDAADAASAKKFAELECAVATMADCDEDIDSERKEEKPSAKENPDGKDELAEALEMDEPSLEEPSETDAEALSVPLSKDELAAFGAASGQLNPEILTEEAVAKMAMAEPRPYFLEDLPENLRNNKEIFRLYSLYGKTKAFEGAKKIGKKEWLAAIKRNPENISHMPHKYMEFVDDDEFAKNAKSFGSDFYIAALDKLVAKEKERLAWVEAELDKLQKKTGKVDF